MVERRITCGQPVSKEYRARTRRLRKEQTPEERILWEAIRDHRLNGLHFRRQQAIGSYIVDFICLAASVIVEVDGAGHAEQREYDAFRDEYLAARDMQILRFTNIQVHTDLSQVLTRIANVCTQRLHPSKRPNR